MSLPWIKVYGSLPEHVKAMKLAEMVGDERAWMHVVALWLWASRCQPDGDLSACSASMIATRASWRGDADAWLAALRTVGFIDANGSLHDWDVEQSAHSDSRALARSRQAKRRERLKPPKTTATGDVTRDCHAVSRDVTRDGCVTVTRDTVTVTRTDIDRDERRGERDNYLAPVGAEVGSLSTGKLATAPAERNHDPAPQLSLVADEPAPKERPALPAGEANAAPPAPAVVRPPTGAPGGSKAPPAAPVSGPPTDPVPQDQPPAAPNRRTKATTANAIERAECEAFQTCYRRLFGSPDASLRAGQFMAYRNLRKKHGAEKLMAALTSIGSDPKQHRFWTLGRCVSGDLLDVGGRTQTASSAVYSNDYWDKVPEMAS